MTYPHARSLFSAVDNAMHLAREITCRNFIRPSSRIVAAHTYATPPPPLWTTLDEHNRAFTQTVSTLSELYAKKPTDYEESVRYLSSLQSRQVRP